MAILPEKPASRPAVPPSAATGRLAMMRLLDSDPSGVVIVGLANEIVFANPKAAQFLGISRDVLIGADLRLFCPVAEQFVALIAAIRRPGESQFLDIDMRRAGGNNFRARVWWTETRYGDRDATLLWIDDHSARRLAEETLSQLFDAAPLPMILCGHPGGDVKRANRRAVELFIIGRKITSCRLEDILGVETNRRLMRQLRDSGGYIDNFEAMLQTAYGEAFAGTISGQMITIGDERHFLVGMNDITDRKKAEEMLRRFFDAGPLAMLLARLNDTQVIRINRRASELFAADTGDVGNANYNRKDHTLERYLGSEPASHFLTRLGEGGFVESFEAKLTTDYGESFWAIISGQVVDIDNVRCVLVGVTDITDRKQAELEVAVSRDAAQQATQAKSLFLATMSHEIRTPMNGVMGMLDLLSRTAMTHEQREMVDVIAQSAASLLTIIDDILDLSKIEAGKLTFESIPIRLRNIVEIAVELVGARARDKGLELAWWADNGLPDHFVGDPVRLRQILLNLLSNAVKFTENGHITVRLHRMDGEDDRVTVRFEISDTGIGLTAEQRDRLFTPYAQADASTTRHFGGTGLGLSICQKLTAMMGGELGVDSRVGVGSTFWFELPFAVTPAAPEDCEKALAGLTILVIDDLPEARAHIAATLRLAGACVHDVSEEVSALDLLNDGETFDVAVVDLPFCQSALLAPLIAAVGPQRLLPTTPSNIETAEHWCAGQGLLPPLLKPARASTLVGAIGLAVGRVRESKAEEVDDRRAHRAVSAEEALAAGRLILVAEDNAVNRLVIGRQLSELGLAFELANHGEAAWEMLQNKAYGLLLTDCFMPILDGYELTRRLRRAEKAAAKGAHLPVIALTANVLEGELEKCLAAEMDDYLTKPVFLDRLAAALERWLPKPPPEIVDIKAREAIKVIAPATPVLASPTAVAPDKAILDLDQFAEILGSDDRDSMREVLAFFVETFSELLPTLRQALNDKDRAALRAAAHAAKGAARNACATGLAAVLADLEEQAPTRISLKTLGVLLDRAELEFVRVRQAIGDL